MRYKPGDKVEVMDNQEVPVSWHPAEIVSRSGDTYNIQYDYHCGMVNKRLVEMVSRKFVRPSPSLLQGAESFIMGDIVEVFHQHSWKIAVVMNVLGGKKESKNSKVRHKVSTYSNQYLVRLLGCSMELAIDRSKIRMRHTWHAGNWVPLKKIPQMGDDVMVSMPLKSNRFAKMNFEVPQFNSTAKEYQPGEDWGNIQDEAAPRKSAVISSRSLKRVSPYVPSNVEANGRHVQKFRATEKEGRKQRVVADQVLEKVHAVAYPKETLGETYVHASYDIISNGYNNKMERENQIDFLGYSGFRGSELDNSDSDVCSIGSCSVTNQSLKNYYNHFMPAFCQETDTLCSDAESSYGSDPRRESFSLSPEEEVEVSICNLELHAYRRTLEALYASGPLSWDQEAVLTNLRIMLHISNDEHLKELKHLISTKTGLQLEACIICFQWSKDDARVCSLSLGFELWTIQSSSFKEMLLIWPVPEDKSSYRDEAVKNEKCSSLVMEESCKHTVGSMCCSNKSYLGGDVGHAKPSSRRLISGRLATNYTDE